MLWPIIRANLNSVQYNYTVGKKDILYVVETLKEYRNMLYGCPNIHVHTDHKNNTFHRLQLQRVLRWRLFLEDFNVQFHYIKGKNNSFADALSHLPFSERQNPLDSPAIATGSITARNDVPGDSSQNQIFTSNAFHDDNLIDCFVHLPYTENIPYVLDYQTIATAQAGDAQLQLLQQRQPNKFQLQLLAPNTSVLVYLAEPNTEWRGPQLMDRVDYY